MGAYSRTTIERWGSYFDKLLNDNHV